MMVILLDNDTYYRKILMKLESLKARCEKTPGKYLSIVGLKYSGKLNEQKKYILKNYLTDIEINNIKKIYLNDNFTVSFRWCTSKLLDQIGLEISLLCVLPYDN